MGITTRCSPDGNVLSALGGAPGADGADKGKVTKNPKSPFEVMADALGNVFSGNSKVTKPRLASLSATDDGVEGQSAVSLAAANFNADKAGGLDEAYEDKDGGETNKADGGVLPVEFEHAKSLYELVAAPDFSAELTAAKKQQKIYAGEAEGADEADGGMDGKKVDTAAERATEVPSPGFGIAKPPLGLSVASASLAQQTAGKLHAFGGHPGTNKGDEDLACNGVENGSPRALSVAYGQAAAPYISYVPYNELSTAPGYFCPSAEQAGTDELVALEVKELYCVVETLADKLELSEARMLKFEGKQSEVAAGLEAVRDSLRFQAAKVDSVAKKLQLVSASVDTIAKAHGGTQEELARLGDVVDGNSEKVLTHINGMAAMLKELVDAKAAPPAETAKAGTRHGEAQEAEYLAELKRKIDQSVAIERAINATALEAMVDNVVAEISTVGCDTLVSSVIAAIGHQGPGAACTAFNQGMADLMELVKGSENLGKLYKLVQPYEPDLIAVLRSRVQNALNAAEAAAAEAVLRHAEEHGIRFCLELSDGAGAHLSAGCVSRLGGLGAHERGSHGRVVHVASQPSQQRQVLQAGTGQAGTADACARTAPANATAEVRADSVADALVDDTMCDASHGFEPAAVWVTHADLLLQPQDEPQVLQAGTGTPVGTCDTMTKVEVALRAAKLAATALVEHAMADASHEIELVVLQVRHELMAPQAAQPELQTQAEQARGELVQTGASAAALADAARVVGAPLSTWCSLHQGGVGAPPSKPCDEAREDEAQWQQPLQAAVQHELVACDLSKYNYKIQTKFIIFESGCGVGSAGSLPAIVGIT